MQGFGIHSSIWTMDWTPAAAEHAVAAHGAWRGVTMDLLLHAVTHVWPLLFAPASHLPNPLHTVLELPAVPCR